MTSTECGWCKRLAHMEAASTVHPLRGRAAWQMPIWQAAFSCANCNGLNLATTAADVEGPYGYGPGVDDLVWDDPDGATQWLPRAGEAQHFPDVPEHIAAAAGEATLCLSSGAYRAVGALARAVVEATAKDKGITKGDLRSKIDELVARKLVRELVAEQGHELRHFGNDMAHGDFTQPTTEAEAEEIVGLMAEVLREVYQAPAELQRLKDKREAKKAAQ